MSMIDCKHVYKDVSCSLLETITLGANKNRCSKYSSKVFFVFSVPLICTAEVAKTCHGRVRNGCTKY